MNFSHFAFLFAARYYERTGDPRFAPDAPADTFGQSLADLLADLAQERSQK